MKASKIIRFILIALACVGLVIIVVSLAAFKYSEKQTNSVIYKDLSHKTGQDASVQTSRYRPPVSEQHHAHFYCSH